MVESPGIEPGSSLGTRFLSLWAFITLGISPRPSCRYLSTPYISPQSFGPWAKERDSKSLCLHRFRYLYSSRPYGSTMARRVLPGIHCSPCLNQRSIPYFPEFGRLFLFITGKVECSDTSARAELSGISQMFSSWVVAASTQFSRPTMHRTVTCRAIVWTDAFLAMAARTWSTFFCMILFAPIPVMIPNVSCSFIVLKYITNKPSCQVSRVMFVS